MIAHISEEHVKLEIYEMASSLFAQGHNASNPAELFATMAISALSVCGSEVGCVLV